MPAYDPKVPDKPDSAETLVKKKKRKLKRKPAYEPNAIPPVAKPGAINPEQPEDNAVMRRIKKRKNTAWSPPNM